MTSEQVARLLIVGAVSAAAFFAFLGMAAGIALQGG